MHKQTHATICFVCTTTSAQLDGGIGTEERPDREWFVYHSMRFDRFCVRFLVFLGDDDHSIAWPRCGGSDRLSNPYPTICPLHGHGQWVHAVNIEIWTIYCWQHFGDMGQPQHHSTRSPIAMTISWNWEIIDQIAMIDNNNDNDNDSDTYANQVHKTAMSVWNVIFRVKNGFSMLLLLLLLLVLSDWPCPMLMYLLLFWILSVRYQFRLNLECALCVRLTINEMELNGNPLVVTLLQYIRLVSCWHVVDVSRVMCCTRSQTDYEIRGNQLVTECEW